MYNESMLMMIVIIIIIEKNKKYNSNLGGWYRYFNIFFKNELIM